MIYEESFGIIPIKKHGDSFLVFLVQLKSGKHYGFPKGRSDPGENPIDAATRELKEETNLDVVKLLQNEALIEEYQIQKDSETISKKVYYFIAEVGGKVNLEIAEIIEGRWVDIKEASDIITYNPSKEIAKEVIKILTIE